MKRISSLLILLALALPATVALAQTTTPETPVTAATQPTDPKELMLLAANSNGLNGADTRPWHLKVSFKLLDDKGNTTDQGTYEELWASPSKYKRTFTTTTQTQTDFGTDKGILRSGGKDDLPKPLLDLRREFASEFPTQQTVERESFTLQKIASNGSTLSCLRYAISQYSPDRGVMYCLEADRPVLRVSVYSGESLQILHNRILNFQGRFVAGDLSFVRAGKPILIARLDTLETLSPVTEADFTPPADAVPLKRVINISSGVATGLIVQKVAPIYPPGAKISGVTGTVVLQAIIDLHGHIKDLSVISGPTALQQAALDAVRQWKYKPYILNGDPVEVHTQINVIFSLGR